MHFAVETFAVTMQLLWVLVVLLYISGVIGKTHVIRTSNNPGDNIMLGNNFLTIQVKRIAFGSLCFITISLHSFT